MITKTKNRVFTECTPIINKTHWIASRLHSVFVPGLGHGYNLLGKGAPIYLNTTGTFTPTRYGKAIKGTAQTAYHSTRSIYAKSGFPIVQIVLGYISSGADNYYLSSGVQSAVGTSGEAFNISLFSTTQVQYVFRTGFGTTATTIITTGSGTNSGLWICALGQSLSATDHRFYANGLSSTSSTNTGTPSSFYDIFSIGGASLKTLNGGVIYCGYGTSAFSDQEALYITSNPESFFEMFTNYRIPSVNSISASGGVIKTFNSVTMATVNKIDDVLNTSVKSINGIANV